MRLRMYCRVAALALAAIACHTVTTTSIAGPYLLNGDFEADAQLWTVWPGYVGQAGINPAEITGWVGAGGRGINPVVPGGPTDAPFRDNGANTSHVAFLQGAAHIQQDIVGLTVGASYWLGVDFNARNCCGDLPVATLFLNDQPIASSTYLFPPSGAIPPVGGANPWYHADISFIAFQETITLRIASQPATGGDATLVVDNVSVTLIPEPSTVLLGLLGLAAICVLPRRRS